MEDTLPFPEFAGDVIASEIMLDGAMVDEPVNSPEVAAIPSTTTVVPPSVQIPGEHEGGTDEAPHNGIPSPQPLAPGLPQNGSVAMAKQDAAPNGYRFGEVVLSAWWWLAASAIALCAVLGLRKRANQ